MNVYRCIETGGISWQNIHFFITFQPNIAGNPDKGNNFLRTMKISSSYVDSTDETV